MKLFRDLLTDYFAANWRLYPCWRYLDTGHQNEPILSQSRGWRKTMRLALKSALMLTTRVIQIINPELQLHMQRTALIALELSLALELPRSQQQTIFCAALLHDIGVLGDKRIVTSLNDIDNIEDPHQHRGRDAQRLTHLRACFACYPPSPL